ncbi:MAG TPA: hypothetical protein VM782_11020, partial [Stellaceae bacterium]|nr:hypothetical protein [Stellaceae bacterium]
VIWSVPAAATLLLLVVATPRPPRSGPASSVEWRPDWRRAFPLGMLLGGTGGLYFLGNAFIPDYLHAIGRLDLVSAALGALNLAQLPASAMTLVFARRMTSSRALLIACPLMAGAALVGLVMPVPELTVAAAGLIGFFCGIQLVVSLALPPLIARPEDVHRLSAGAFTIGYLTAFVMSPIGGAIWDATGTPASAFATGVLCIALVIAAALSLPELRTARAA